MVDRKKDFEKSALVLNIQRLSTEDGPGLRTTVFFKGCNLHCSWCHNPESISACKQIEWRKVRCMGCGLCLLNCKNKALLLTKDGISIDRKACVACEACVRACPTLALETKGTEWALDDLVYEVLKDRNYFEGKGGITASGGECLLQGQFLKSFFRKLRAEGIHTALDTAGLVSKEELNAILPHTNLVLYDLKLFDLNLHKKYTGAGNTTILNNARYIAEYCNTNQNTELWIRTPIIPGITDSEDNIYYIGRFIAEYLHGAESKWELLAFNNLCEDKYDRLDMDWKLKDKSLVSKEKMQRLCEVAKGSGVRPEVVVWTGSTKLETEGK